MKDRGQFDYPQLRYSKNKVANSYYFEVGPVTEEDLPKER